MKIVDQINFKSGRHIRSAYMADCAVIKISRHPDGGWLVQQYHKDGSKGVSHLLHSGNPPWGETLIITEGQFTPEQAARIENRPGEVAAFASN